VGYREGNRGDRGRESWGNVEVIVGSGGENRGERWSE
jgi:hypothetical protein